MRYTTTVLLTVLIFYLSGIASENLQTQILTAKNRVLPALVHIEPVKEIFSDEFDREHVCADCGQKIDFTKCAIEAEAG